MMYPVYILSGGAVVKQILDGVVGIIGSHMYATLTQLAILLSIYGAVYAFIRKRSLVELLKWFATYFVISSVFLGVKMNLEIIDATNPGAVYTVGNVPIGLGYPLSIITTVGHGMASLFDRLLHKPDERSYVKTGMLFGSKLYTMATSVGIQSANVQADINEYFKNCIVGDMYIVHKYSPDDLKTAKNIWTLVSKNPSPIRGMIFQPRYKGDNPQFVTCQAATPTLQRLIQNDIQKKGLPALSVRIFGHQTPDAMIKLDQYLRGAYQHFSNISSDSTDIITQNVMVSAIRKGIQNYAGEKGAIAAMMNYETEKSLHAQNISWALSRNIAALSVPLLQTILLMVMVGLFPLIAVLALQHHLAPKILANYIWTLLWLESWPLLFAIANAGVNAYTKTHVGMADGGITLSNMNPAALLHSYQANMAGYFMTLIPFLALGVVKGMASAFNNAANYIGGGAHQVASSSGMEAATGNISLGNMSYNNVNANKWDTNATYMHGQGTQQLQNGSTVSTMADGSRVYNGTPSISQLGTQLHMGRRLDQSLTQQSNESLQSANSHKKSLDKLISSMANHIVSDGNSAGHQTNVGGGSSHSQDTSYNQAMNTINQIADRSNSRTHMGKDKTIRKVLEGAAGISAGVNANAGVGFTTPKYGQPKQPGLNDAMGGKTPKLPGKISTNVTGASFGAGASISADGGIKRVKDNAKTNSFGFSNDLQLTTEESKNLQSSFKTLTSDRTNQHMDANWNANNQYNNQFSADFRKAINENNSWLADLQQSQSYNQMASFVEHNNAYSDENMSQGLAQFVEKNAGSSATYILTNQSEGARQLRQTYTNRFLEQEKGKLVSKFKVDSSGINPTQFYKNNVTAQQALPSATDNFKRNRGIIQSKAKGEGLNSQHIKKTAHQLDARVHHNQHQTQTQLKQDGQAVLQKQKTRKATTKENVDIGKKNASHSFFNCWSNDDEPKDVK